MNKNIITGIEKHTGYNTGGISNIFLLDIRSFIAYRFTDDMLFDECFVESVRISDYNYIEVETIESSKFQESMDNGIYKQQLTTFVRKLGAPKTSNLLRANAKKYLVLFKTYENKYFCFGSDGGATVSFSQISGEIGGSSGYNLTINKSSVYPLFQIGLNNRVIESLLITENNHLITTEDNCNCRIIIEVLGVFTKEVLQPQKERTKANTFMLAFVRVALPNPCGRTRISTFN